MDKHEDPRISGLMQQAMKIMAEPFNQYRSLWAYRVLAECFMLDNQAMVAKCQIQ